MAQDKESDVKVVSISLFVSVVFFVGAAQAGSLGKYSSEQLQAPVKQQQPSVEQHLKKKINRAIQIVNSLDEKDKQRWVKRYRQSYKDALEKKDRKEAAYYQKILAGITKQE